MEWKGRRDTAAVIFFIIRSSEKHLRHSYFLSYYLDDLVALILSMQKCRRHFLHGLNQSSLLWLTWSRQEYASSANWNIPKRNRDLQIDPRRTKSTVRLGHVMIFRFMTTHTIIIFMRLCLNLLFSFLPFFSDRSFVVSGQFFSPLTSLLISRMEHIAPILLNSLFPALTQKLWNGKRWYIYWDRLRTSLHENPQRSTLKSWKRRLAWMRGESQILC